MRRVLSILLTLVLTLGCATPALAVWEEETVPVVTQTEEDYDWYYEEEEWSDEDWLAWSKELMGMPFPEGVNVSVNGTYLSLDGVAPLKRAGRTMVPVLAFFAEQGAAVVCTADGVITATLEDGAVLTLTLDSTVMTVRDPAGQTRQVEMDVAPYVDGETGHTYIPVRFAAEAMGYDVEWDGDYQVAMLTNWDALIAQLDSHYTVLNEILAASYNVYDVEKNYSIRETMKMAGTLYGEDHNDTATISMSVSALASGDLGRMSMDLSGKVDLGGLEDTLFPNLDQETRGILAAISNMKLSAIMDLEQGDMYMKLAGLEQVSQGMVEDDVWYYVGGAGMDEYGISMDGLRSMTMGSLLVTLVQTEWDPYQSLQEYDQVLSLLVGDNCWTKKTTGPTTTYTNKLNAVTLVKRLAGALAEGEMGLSDLGLDGQLPAMDITMTCKLQDGVLVESTCKGDIDLTGIAPITIGLDSTYRNGVGKASFDITGAYVGKLVVTTDSKLTETSKEVPAAPPSGEPVVDLS